MENMARVVCSHRASALPIKRKRPIDHNKMSDRFTIAHSIYTHLISSLFGAHGVHLLFDAALLAEFFFYIVEILLYKCVGLAE